MNSRIEVAYGQSPQRLGPKPSACGRGEHTTATIPLTQLGYLRNIDYKCILLVLSMGRLALIFQLGCGEKCLPKFKNFFKMKFLTPLTPSNCAPIV